MARHSRNGSVYHSPFDRYVHNFTARREEMLGDTKDPARDSMFIDPSPYLSLRGFGLGDSAQQRSRDASKNPRARTTLGEAGMNLSCGKKSSVKPAEDGAPAIHRGSPPMPLRGKSDA
jgi:hypothetical protein